MVNKRWWNLGKLSECFFKKKVGARFFHILILVIYLKCWGYGIMFLLGVTEVCGAECFM